MWRWIRCSFFLLLFLFLLLPSPVFGADVLHVRGDSMRITGLEKNTVLEGNVLLTYQDIVVFADHIEIMMEELTFVAKGRVLLQQRGQFLECQELTYYLDEDTSIFVDANTRFHDEEDEHQLFFSSPYIEGDSNRFDMLEGTITPCDMERPHIYFQSTNVIVYPGDYLVANNVVFWELGGLLPLFYWPVLYLPLEEDQTLIPRFGYSRERGFFVKMAYNYFTDAHKGTFFLDYYGLTGLGTGVRHYYLDADKDEGYFYIYLLENRTKETGWDYFQANLSHSQTILDWRANLALKYRLVPEDRQNIELSLGASSQWDRSRVSYKGGFKGEEDLAKETWDRSFTSTLSFLKQWDRSRLDYTGDFKGEEQASTEIWSRFLANKVNYRLSLPFNSLYTMGLEQRLIEDGEGLFSIYEGEGKFTQRGNAHTLEVLFKQDRPQRYERDAIPRFSALPEIKLDLNPSRVYSFPDPFRGWINPLRFEGLLANYKEEATGAEGVKLKGEFRYNRSFRPFQPLTINLSQQGKTNFYYMEEISIEDPDYSFGVSDSRVSAGLQPFRGLNLGLDYSLRTTQGSSPFSFDRETPQEEIAGNVVYSWRTGRARLSSSYSLLTDVYADLKGDLTLTPFQGFRTELTATYSIEDQDFKGLVANYRIDRGSFRHDLAVSIEEKMFKSLAASYRIQLDGFKHDLALSVDRDWEIEKVETQLRWDIGDILDLGFKVQYYPQARELKQGEIFLVWDLHCREISLSYDHLKEEFWLRYSLPAFSGYKVSLGASSDEPMLFDLELGGIIDD